MNPQNISVSKSLTERVVTSGGWVITDKITVTVLRLTTLLFLARLLGPKEFGLYAIAILTIETTEIFTRISVDTALIRQPGDVEHYLDTAWTIQAMRASVLAVGLWLLSPFIAEFFREPRASTLIKVLALSVLGRGFLNNAVLYFLKDLRFHKQYIFDVLPAFASSVIGISFGFLWRNAWALVWADLGGTLTSFVFSYILCFRIPRFRFNFKQAKDLLGFAMWLLGSSLSTFFARRIPEFIIGRILGATLLGLFTMASRLVSIVPDHLSFVANTLGMPAYAKVQTDNERLSRVFTAALELSMMLSFCIASFLSFTAHDIVLIALGNQWIDIVLPIRILSFSIVFLGLRACYQPVFVACNVPRYLFMENGIWAITVATTIFPLTRIWGLHGSCLSCLLGSVCSIFFLPKAVVISGASWYEFIGVVGRALFVALGFSCPILFFHKVPLIGTPLLRLIFQLVLSVILGILIIRRIPGFYDYKIIGNIVCEKLRKPLKKDVSSCSSE